jgi:hypothetical protein
MALASGTVERRDERIGIAAGVTVAFGAAAVLARDGFGVHLVCPLRALTDVPCPGCGMTSVASSLAHGDVAGAVTSDPAGVLLVLVVAALAVVHLAIWWSPVLARRLPGDPALVLAGGLALVAHWATTLLAA